MLINATVNPIDGPLAITAVYGEAVNFNTGRIVFTVSKPCTIRARFMSGGGQPTVKGDTTAGGDFPADFESVLGTPGTYSLFDGSDAGGTLSELTAYTIGIYGWAEGFIEGEVGNEETAVINSTNPAFTTPAQGALAAPTIITPTSFSLNESVAIGTAWGGLTNNGVPDTGTWSITSDVDGVANIDASTGVLTLESTLVYATSTSHSVTVNFANTEGNTSEVITLTVLEAAAASTIPVADSTKGTLADIYADIVANWTLAGGEYTAPGSPTDYTFALSAGDAASNWVDYKFTHPVTIRGTGTPTAGWDSVNKKPTRGGVTELTGQLNIGASKNLRLILMSLNKTIITGSELVTLERCSIYGSDQFNGTSTVSTLNGNHTLTLLGGATDFTLKDCNISFGRENLFYINTATTRLTVDGFVGDLVTADCLRWAGNSNNHTDITTKNCWFPRTIRTYGSPHLDSQQFIGALFNGVVSEYNVICAPYSYNGQKARLQGFFMNAASTTGQEVYVRQQIHCSDYGDQMRMANPVIGTVSFRYTEIMQPADNAAPLPFAAGQWNDFDYNIGTGNQPSKIGTNDETLVYTPNATNPTVASASGLYTGDPTGLETVGFEVFEPPSSAVRSHWDFAGGAGRVGAWDLKKRVFVDGLHPGNIGWPVAEVWERQFNPTGTIGTTHTGTYDADGSNV